MNTMNPRPPGLMSREAFHIGTDVVIVDETWNIDVPGCPMIRNPWTASSQQVGSIFVRRLKMTENEFSSQEIPLFSEDKKNPEA